MSPTEARFRMGAALQQAFEAGYEDARQWSLMSADDADRWRPTTETRLPVRLGVQEAIGAASAEVGALFPDGRRHTPESYARRLRATLRSVYGLGLRLGGVE